MGLLLSGMQSAQADVTVVYKMTSPDGSGAQTVYYHDKQHVRVDMDSGSHAKMSMLKLGNKVYSITGKVVQDMEQLSKMMAAMGMGRHSGQATGHKGHARMKYTDTGRTETIAGIKGKVYSFVDNGRRHEVVLGEDRDLQAAVLGVVEIGKVAGGQMPFTSTNRVQQDASTIKSMAMLRLDQATRLQSIDRHPIPKSKFTLTAEPQQMGAACRV